MLLIYIFGLVTLVIASNVVESSPTHRLSHQPVNNRHEIITPEVVGIPNARFKRQESTLQQTLQNLQNTQQQQSQAQRQPGQGGLNNGFNQGTNNQGFGNNNQQFGGGGGFDSTGSGQDTGFTNGDNVSSGFNQGFGSNGQNQGGFSNGGGNAQGGFNNGNFGTGGGTNNGLGTTVRNPLNVATDENTIPEAACMRRCQPLMQFNPVCGSDNITYTNQQRFRCAQQCGRQVQLAYYGTCIATQPPSTK